jgi:hypothetical protein
VGSEFWNGMRDFLLFMTEQEVFDAKEIGFGRIVDDPKEAVDLVVCSLPSTLRDCLRPPCRSTPKQPD